MASILDYYNITEAKKAKFFEGFLYLHPIPLDNDGNPEYADEEEWLDAWTKNTLIRMYKTGKYKKAHADLAVIYDL